MRESKVNALQASLLAFPTLVRLLVPTERDNGMLEQALTFTFDEGGITVARQLVIYTRFLINSRVRETSNGDDCLKCKEQTDAVKVVQKIGD